MLNTKRRRSAAVAGLAALALAIAACGTTDTTTDDPADDGDSAEGSTTPSDPEEAPTTAGALSSEVEAAETDDDEAASAAEEPTTTSQVSTETPLAGLGVLTIDGIDYEFTVSTCSFEPTIQEQTLAVISFSMRGMAEAEGREVHVNAARIELNGNLNDTYGYAYADDPSDFETAVSVGTGGSQGELFAFDGQTITAGPVAFRRVEGISEVEDADPGPGSIRFACDP